jgi:hypothetical protein
MVSLINIVTILMTETKVTTLQNFRTIGNTLKLKCEFRTPRWKERRWKLCILRYGLCALSAEYVQSGTDCVHFSTDCTFPVSLNISAGCVT